MQRPAFKINLGNVSVISKHPAKPPGAFGTSGTSGAGASFA